MGAGGAPESPGLAGQRQGSAGQAGAQDQQRGLQSRLRRRPDPAAGTVPRVAGAAGLPRALRPPERPRRPREERRRIHPWSAGAAISAAIH